MPVLDNYLNVVERKRKIFPWVKDSPPHVVDIDEFRLKMRDTTTCAGIYGLKLSICQQPKPCTPFYKSDIIVCILQGITLQTEKLSDVSPSF